MRHSDVRRGSGVIRRVVAGWRGVALLCAAVAGLAAPSLAQDTVAAGATRLDVGRFTIVHFEQDARLARALAARAVAEDTFPGLPRPADRVVIALAPDRRRFVEWTGGAAPEWGAAVAFPQGRRIVMQGRDAGRDAGDPLEVLRHELAHLALHEFLEGRAPRWFDEGYASFAAREWRREDVLAANLALLIRGAPTFERLDQDFEGGAGRAGTAYALAFRAVADLAELHPRGDLTPFLTAWRTSGSLERAIRSSYGLTLNGFEDRWRTRIRRRYGVLALAGNFTLAMAVLALILFPVHGMRRRRTRERMEAMRVRESAAELRAMEQLAELDAAAGMPLAPGDGPAEGPAFGPADGPDDRPAGGERPDGPPGSPGPGSTAT
jgi:hypothetical protein